MLQGGVALFLHALSSVRWRRVLDPGMDKMHVRDRLCRLHLEDSGCRGLGWRSCLTDNGPAMNALEIADDHAKVAIGSAGAGAVAVRMTADGGDVVIGHVRLGQLNAPECRG
jgi:hypothetical protein